MLAMQNQLTEFAQLERYRRLYKSRGTLIILFSLVSFAIGFAVAKFVYKDSAKLNQAIGESNNPK